MQVHQVSFFETEQFLYIYKKKLSYNLLALVYLCDGGSGSAIPVFSLEIHPTFYCAQYSKYRDALAKFFQILNP